MTDPIFRLGAFARNGAAKLGLVFAGRNAPATKLEGLLENWDRSFDALREIAAGTKRNGVAKVWRLEDARPLPPLADPKRLFYAAANYSDHVAGIPKTFTSALPAAGEAKAALRPYLFVKACAMSGARETSCCRRA
jgi:2-keto-4-pentenoate hydratase/2-oxohepta-3-ene-1,7-dioic acid hydratase in catechol pathway